jgi:hypothetical protein
MNTETSAEPRTWKSEAGPIQSKKVRGVLQAISSQHNTRKEKWGVIGGEEHEMCFFSPFGGGSREDVTAAWNKLGEQFGWKVTRENYAGIIEAANAELITLRANTPVDDKRRTVEEDAYQKDAMRQAEEKRRIERENAEALRKAAESKPVLASVGQPGTPSAYIIVRKNEEHNGVEIQFPGKPSPDVIARCKAAGFRWSFHSKVWYKKFGAYSWAQAHTIAGLPLPGERDPGEAAAPFVAELAREQELPVEEVAPDRFDMQVEDNMAAACGL